MRKYKIIIILFLLSLYILTPVSAFFLLGEETTTRLTYSILSLMAFVLITEFLFYFLISGFLKYDLKFDKKFKKDQVYFNSHPYLPFEMKKNMNNTNRIKAEYKNTKFTYFFPKLSSNSLGFANGSDGSREVEISKDINAYRINCIGGSTTGNYLEYENNVYSYPLILEELIKKNIKDKKIEVNNFGQGGYNSYEILISFLLKVLYTKPNMVLLYIGYNDIKSYLTKNFNYDYSHSRKKINLSNLGFFLNDFLPDIKLNFYRFLLQKLSIRNSLIDSVSIGEFDINQNPENGLKVFRNNLENIITICKSRNITLVLSSFCTNKNKIDNQNYIGRKFLEIVNLENKIIKELSIKYNCEFVDNDSLIEKYEENFVDSIHFSHVGMEKLAANFFNKINKYLEN